MIRRSIANDVPGLLALSEASGLFPSEHLDVLREMLSEYFSSPKSDGRFWLTDIEDTQVVGVVYCEPEAMTNETWNLRLIAVSPELQGRGRGAALVAHTEQYLADSGGRLLIVDTSGTQDFEPVREFYRRCGYQQATRIPDFFDLGDDKITFMKMLKTNG